MAGADLNSTNPLALQALPAGGKTDGKSVVFDGHATYVDSSGFAVLAPTMLRTGTGAIDVAAGNGIALFNAAAAQANDADVTVPGVIYTAGRRWRPRLRGRRWRSYMPEPAIRTFRYAGRQPRFSR